MIVFYWMKAAKQPSPTTMQPRRRRGVSFIFLLLTAASSAFAFQQECSSPYRQRRRFQVVFHRLHSTQGSTPPPQSPPQTSAATASSSSSVESSFSSHAMLSSSIQSHHVAIKTRNIEMAIKFYSLLGFHVETKFVAGPARAAWLLHDYNGEAATRTTKTASIKSRIELIEVPSYMLNEPEGMKRRALDLMKREELLGLNHFCFDVSNCILLQRSNRRKDIVGGDNTLISNIDSIATTSSTTTTATASSSCSVYNLQEYLQDLNSQSITTFNKSLRIALHPIKRIIGRDVYEMAFIYDADGALIELLNYSCRLLQEVDDGWEPWDGEGFVL